MYSIVVLMCRCFRLKKDCRPSTPVRRRASGKKSSSAMMSRTAQLEQKLDGLVSLLTAQTNSHLKDKETVREGSAATAGTDPATDTATDTAHSCGSDSAPETSARGTPAPSTTGYGDYSVESRTLSAVNNDFRPALPNGPEFGCGMMPQAIPPLTARIATSLPRRGDVSGGENGCAALGLGMSGMPRTPESSTSSNVPAPGGSQSHGKRQHEHSQQNPQSTHDTQNAQNPQAPQPNSSIPNVAWGFSFFPNTPKASRTTPFGNSGQSAPDDPLNLGPELTPSLEEAEHSFQVFRSTMLPYFPFVHLPADLTAQQLRETRPYFWLAIMSMTYQRLPGHVQQARSTHLRALFAQRIVLESEKSLDLLQSLLTFLTWIHYTSRRDRPTLSVITQLAVSLVYDLGLHKYMAPCKSLIARLVRDHYQQSYGPGLTTFSNSGAGTDDFPEPHVSSLDERRAALACYVLTSKFSLALKRCDTLKWTSRMEEHLAEISSKAESALDHVLVVQVRMQRVADFVSQGDWQSSDPNTTSALSLDCMAIGNGYMPGVNEDNARRLMPSFVVHMVRAKIEEIKDSIPAEVRQHDAVLDAIYAVDMIVSAAAVMPVIAPVLSMATITVVAIRSLSRRARSRSGAHTQPPNLNLNQNQNQNQRQPYATQTSSTLASDFAHIAALERCVESVAAFWAFFQRITSGSFSALPFAYFAHFTLCIVLLYGLSVIDEPNWDRAAVRDRLQVLDMLDGFIAKLADAPRIVPSAGQDSYDVFSRAATMLGSVRELWAADFLDNDGGAERVAERAGGRAGGRAGARMPPTSAPRPTNNAPAQQPTATAMASASTAAPPSRLAQRTMHPEMNMGMPTDAPAWQMPPMPAAGPGPVGMPTMDAGDTAMGDAPPATPQDPSLLLGPDMAVPDLFSVMGLSDDYMFWDLFLPGEDGAPQI